MKNKRDLMAALVILLLFFGLCSPTLVSAVAPAQVPATGQVSPIYGRGEDSQLQKGVEWPFPRFYELGDGTVQDALTGLIWAQDAGTIGGNGCSAGERTWQEALDYIACLNSGSGYLGYSDWVLPNVNELKSLLSLETLNPSLPESHPFTAVHSGFYWSSTTSASSDVTAWIVDFTDGYLASDALKIMLYYVWPLRAPAGTGAIHLAKTGQTTSYADGDDGSLQRGVNAPPPRYLENGDGIVTDTLTNLVWGKDANTAGPVECAVLEPGLDKRWMEALDFIACLNNNRYLGYGDWRLPNYNELTSLTDYSRAYPALNIDHPFSILAASSFWTSTTYADDISLAWYDTIDTGEVLPGDTVSAVYAVWPVRDAIWTLTVIRIGSGIVVPDIGELNWTGDTGIASFGHGTVLSLTATADSGNSFSSWEGACSGSGACMVTMEAAKTVTATFKDQTAPTVTAFTLPTTSNSLTVAISDFNASDNMGVTGYCLTESNSSSGCTWSAGAPASYLFASAGSKTLYAFVQDAAGNLSGSASATTNIDITAPTVTFTLPATSRSLSVAISSFTASDSVGVTGYCLVATNSSSGCAWNASAPTSYSFAVDGSQTLYAFARDAAGNISVSLSASTTIDLIAPATPTVALTTDSGASNSDLITKDGSLSLGIEAGASVEYSSDSGTTWKSSFVAVAGNNSVQVRQTDVAGNISGVSGAYSFILDLITPTVTAFTLPATSNSLTVAISSFTASDTIGVTGYCLSEIDNSSGCLWSASAPTSYSFVSAGSKTLYAFAEDAAGNISASLNASTTINDVTAPTVTFTLPATSSSLSVAISSFTASDSVGVTGYCLVATNSSSGCAWNLTTPASYTFTGEGTKVLYAFARDAAGNISASVSATTTIAVIYGDLNNNQETDAGDALFALQMAVGKRDINSAADVAPLVNGIPKPNGKVTAADAMVIMRRAVGLW